LWLTFDAKATTGQISIEELLAEYDGLTSEDIQACLFFASQSLSGTSFMPLGRAAEMSLPTM